MTAPHPHPAGSPPEDASTAVMPTLPPARPRAPWWNCAHSSTNGDGVHLDAPRARRVIPTLAVRIAFGGLAILGVASLVKAATEHPTTADVTGFPTAEAHGIASRFATAWLSTTPDRAAAMAQDAAGWDPTTAPPLGVSVDVVHPARVRVVDDTHAVVTILAHLTTPTPFGTTPTSSTRATPVGAAAVPVHGRSDVARPAVTPLSTVGGNDAVPASAVPGLPRVDVTTSRPVTTVRPPVTTLITPTVTVSKETVTQTHTETLTPTTTSPTTTTTSASPTTSSTGMTRSTQVTSWLAADIPVTAVGGRVVVSAPPALVALPAPPKPPAPTQALPTPDAALSEATRATVMAFFTAFAAGDVDKLAATTAPGVTFPALPAGVVTLRAIPTWQVYPATDTTTDQNGVGERLAMAEVSYATSTGALTTAKYRLVLVPLRSGTTTMWRIKDLAAAVIR